MNSKKIIFILISFLSLFVVACSSGSDVEFSTINSVDRNGRFSAPNFMTLAAPAMTPNIVDSIVVRFGGVGSDNIVKIYSDSECQFEVGRAIAEIDYVDIPVSNLTLGTHTFFSTREIEGKDRSECSSSFVSYEYANDLMVMDFLLEEGENDLTLPLKTGFNYNFSVDWGDGTSSAVNSSDDVDRFHDYGDKVGAFRVVIAGVVEAWSYEDVRDDATKLISVLDLGNVGLVNLDGAFKNCINLISVSGGSTIGVTSMVRTFDGAVSFSVGDLSNWITTSVTDMRSTFENTPMFDLDISSWDVSSVRSMDRMFYDAQSFNQDISGWRVNSVTSMSSMFERSYRFNQNISPWNVSNVTNMSSMFNTANAFAQDIGSWNVSKVTDMSSMFFSVDFLNIDLNRWDVSSVTNMKDMFHSAIAFNGDISSWNTSSVTDMSGMFYQNQVFNRDIGSWNVGQVTDMHEMFRLSANFNQDIGAWNVSRVTDMSGMFNKAERFNQNLRGWTVAAVVDSTGFDIDASNWNTSFKPNF